MARSTKLLLCLLVILAVLPCIFGGHLVHDFYKCSSDWYKSFFKRCKRNLEFNNGASTTVSSVVMMVLSVGIYYLL